MSAAFRHPDKVRLHSNQSSNVFDTETYSNIYQKLIDLISVLCSSSRLVIISVGSRTFAICYILIKCDLINRFRCNV